MPTLYSAYTHSPGDGFHYIHPDGYTSENCILYTLHVVTFRYNLPGVADLWNTVYPDDPMSFDDTAAIIASALPYINNFQPVSPDDVSAVVDDLRAIRCDELADHVTVLLRNKGAAI